MYEIIYFLVPCELALIIRVNVGFQKISRLQFGQLDEGMHYRLG